MKSYGLIQCRVINGNLGIPIAYYGESNIGRMKTTLEGAWVIGTEELCKLLLEFIIIILLGKVSGMNLKILSKKRSN